MGTPFEDFAGFVQRPSELRARITAAYRRPERECIAALLDGARLPPAQAAAAQRLAGELARALRQRGSGTGREGLVQGLIQEFSLSSQEGVALMCLAEALLRVPDNATRDALIRDKIGDADWGSHLGRSGSLFVNAATWGLLVTGKLVTTHSESGLGSALARSIGKQRRAADPQGRRHGDAPDGRPVRHRRDDRVGTAERQAARTRGLPLLVRHARRGRAHRRRRAALPAGLRAGDPRDRRSVGRPRHLRRAGNLDQAVGPAPALQPGATRAHPRPSSTLDCDSSRFWRGATTSA